MKYDINKLEKILNNINKQNNNLNQELNDTINRISKIDYTNQTKELKYSMYDGIELLYEQFNDDYIEYINSFSESYIKMSEFYVGPCIPKDLFYYKFYQYIFYVYILSVYIYNTKMNEYDVD